MLNIKSKKYSCDVVKKRKISVRELQLYSLLAVPLLLVFVFHYIPLVGISIAFKDYKYNLGILGSKWVGFENFAYFFNSDVFARITWNTLSMNFLFILIGTTVAVILAMLLYEVHSRGATKVFQTVLITPNFISWVIVAYMVFSLLNPNYGFVNVIRKIFGFSEIDWYGEAKYWPTILIIANVWKKMGIDSIMYYAAIMGMDTSLIEAAKIDGAGRIKCMRYIILPSLIPLIVTLTILAIGSIFRADFGLFYQVPRNVGLLYKTTDVVDTYIFRTMREVGDLGLSSAVGVLQSCVGFIMVMITNHITKKISPENSMF